MLYIKGHKIIKGYVGNAPVSYVGFGKSGLIKIKSENGGSDYPDNLIAKYTANASGVLPTFNSGYQYTVNETELNGIYTVEISSDSDFTSCSFRGKTNLLTVDYLKVTSNVTTMINMFNSCSNLTTLDVSNWNTDNVTNMQGMFNGCSNLATLDVSNFNTDNVTLMDYMFQNCNSLTTLDVSNFNTDNVTDMYCMFYKCTNLTSLDLSSFNTSNVTDMRFMFRDCTSLASLDISNFDLNNVGNNTSAIFLNVSNNLLTINMKYSDYNSVNKIIEQLPTRKEDTKGTLNVAGIDDISQVNITIAQSKYWNINTSIFILKTRTT